MIEISSATPAAAQEALPQRARRAGLAFACFFLGFFLAIPLILRTQPFNDPGALWHIKVGDWIIEHESFPHTDPFTWSYAEKPWIPQQWGAELLMSWVHRFGGFDSMLTAMSALLAVMAAGIAVRFLDGGLHWMPVSAIVAMGMAVAGFHFYLRPHLASIVLLAAVTMWLVDFDRGRIGVVRLLWLVPLCAVWTNLHGGVLGGIFTFAVAVVGWTTTRAISVKKSGLLTLILIACLAATLLNPFGMEMHRTWWRIIGSRVLKEHISEHQPLSIAQTHGQVVVAFGLFYAAMLAGVFPKRPRVTWLIPLVWFGLSLTSIRHGPLFCVTALVALADLLPETVWIRLLKRYGDTFVIERAMTPASIGWRGFGVVAAAVLAAVGLQTAHIPIPIIGYGWAGFDPKMVPVELIEPMRQYARTKPVGFPVFNDVNLGGFLIYFTPSLKVFMDDRCELYGDDGILSYVEMANFHPERIEEWAQKAPFDRAIVQADSEKEPAQMDRYLRKSNRWREVMRDRKAVIYERLAPPKRMALE